MSDFDEDMFAPQYPVRDKANGDKGKSEGERGVLCTAVEGEEMVIDPEPGGNGLTSVGNFNPDHIDDKEDRDAEGDDGVRTED